jgi:hypothetical protein
LKAFNAYVDSGKDIKNLSDEDKFLFAVSYFNFFLLMDSIFVNLLLFLAIQGRKIATKIKYNELYRKLFRYI